MSYTVTTPCWACGQSPQYGGNCTDGQKLQAGVNTMYTGDGTHKGSGAIVMMCINVKERTQPSPVQATVQQVPCCQEK